MKKNGLISLGISVCLVFILAVVFVSAAFAQQAPAPKSQGKTALSFGTAGAGSITYVVGAAITRITGKYAPDLPMTVASIPGDTAKVKLLPAKELDLGLATSDVLYDGARGLDDFAKQGKMPVSMVATAHKSLWQLFTVKPEIKTLADLKGRSIMWRKLGAGAKMKAGTATFEWCMKTYGWKKGDWKDLDCPSTSEGVRAVSAGTVDVAGTSAAGAAELMELATTKKSFQIVSYAEECRDYIVKEHTLFSKYPVPKGLYGEYPSQDIPTIGFNNVIFCRTDLAENIVYEITKAIFDHLPEFKTITGRMGDEYTLENAVFNPQVPFHPGAIKYYKEKGIWTNDLQKKQEKLLAECR